MKNQQKSTGDKRSQRGNGCPAKSGQGPGPEKYEKDHCRRARTNTRTAQDPQKKQEGKTWEEVMGGKFKDFKG